MSTDLQWELVRNFNCGLVKRSGCTFSTEPFNLAAKHSYKFSGFAQNKALNIVATENGVAINNKSANVSSSKVSKSLTKPTLYKGTNARRVAAAIEKQLVGGFYRPDLVVAAKARVSALLAAQKPKKVAAKKVRANKLAKLAKARAN